MLSIRTPKSGKAKRAVEKRAPRLVENVKKTLILQGTKTSQVLNSLLTEIYHLKRGSAIRYTRRNDKIRPFESGGETSLEFYSLKTDCSLFVFGSHSKKRPNNLVIGRTYDHHIYDLIEVGVENFKTMDSFSYEKKLAPKVGTKPFFAFIGEGFESVEELRHLKEILLDLFRGQVVENLNLAGVDRIFICTALSSNKVFLTHCALRLKKSGTVVPRMELVEVGPSMDFVVRRHRLPNEGLRKEAMKSVTDNPKKKVKNVSRDVIKGKIGKIYMPDQKLGDMVPSHKVKGLKRERREARSKNDANFHEPKKQKKTDASECLKTYFRSNSFAKKAGKEMGFPSEIRDAWVKSRKRETIFIASPAEEEQRLLNSKLSIQDYYVEFFCSAEGVRAGTKAAMIACVASAVPTLIAVRVIPWAKTNLNYTAQALIISTVTIAAYFVTAEQTILEHARINSRAQFDKAD
ncbi:hypothetical protein GIB67_016926 [Kingdonia uniflora]|uniref:Ribosome production factor 2 homolog n=1 Tax=Kingdonia uniflora TaxID=39325 RepID=A0A7J7M3N4_9MAGN|nr:hypothetical protein GIB67_016926 [Kingdonia uniflora]